MSKSAMIEYDFFTIKKEIGEAWSKFSKASEPHGLAFGKVCLEWYKKIKNTKNDSASFNRICNQLRITAGAAYYWMDKYSESINELPTRIEEPEYESEEAKTKAMDDIRQVNDLERLFPNKWTFYISKNCGGNFNLIFSAIKEKEIREIAKILIDNLQNQV